MFDVVRTQALWVLLWLVAGLIAPLGAAERAVESLPAAAPPVIDGRLDDPCWQAGPWYGDFVVLNQPEARPTAQSRFKIRHDDRYLYLAAHMDEPLSHAIKAEETEHDGKVYSDDCVELMLDANGDRSSHFHFIVNALGTVYDAHRRQGGQVVSLAWNCEGFRAAAFVGEGYWSVEMAVPLVELMLDGGSRGAWGVNVARERKSTVEPEYSTYAPLTGGFHQTALFASMTLRDADIDRYLWDVRAPFSLRAMEVDGAASLLGKTFVTNRSGSFRFLTLRAALDTAERQAQPITAGLDADQAREFDLTVPVDANGPATLTLTLADRGSGEALGFYRFPVEVQYTPLRVILTNPKYRNAIYATQRIEAIEGVIESSLGDKRLEGLRLRVSLRGGADQPIAEQLLGTMGQSAAFRLPIAELAEGDYAVTADLIDDAGTVRHTATTPLRKLAPAPVEIRLDEHMVTRLNGEPHLVYGWFSTYREDWGRDPAPSFNAVLDYNLYWMTPEQQQKFFDDAHAAGMKAAVKPYPNRIMVTPEAQKKPLSDEEAEQIRQFVRQWKTHPGLLAWYLADEPELVPVLPARLEAIRRVCAEEDPYHPCIVLNDSIAGIHRYAHAADVLMPDPYPLFIDGGSSARPIRHVTNFMTAVQEAAAGRIGAWVTPQGFNYGDYGLVNNRAPNFLELRNMQVQAIVAKTTGFLWYSYTSGSLYPELMTGVRFLRHEAEALNAAILAPQTHQSLAVSPDDAHVLTSFRRAQGQEYVFAVNVGEQAVSVTITLPNGSASQWHVVSEGRTLTAEGGALTDSFELNAAHIYTTDQDAARTLSIAEIESSIERIKAQRVKPGNLAHRSHGVTAGVSSSRSPYYKPHLLLDGVADGFGWEPMPGRLPQWIELDFGKSVEVGRIVAYSPMIEKAVVQVRKDGQWTDLSPLEPIQPQVLEARFPTVQAQVLRVLITAVHSTPAAIVTRVGVLELEAYRE